MQGIPRRVERGNGAEAGSRYKTDWYESSAEGIIETVLL